MGGWVGGPLPTEGGESHDTLGVLDVVGDGLVGHQAGGEEDHLVEWVGGWVDGWVGGWVGR